MKKLYLITGPLGVGKTAVCAALAKSIDNCSLIVGDDLYNLEQEQDLEWEEKLQKSWDRILPAVKKQIEGGKNVVLDFVIEDELPQIQGYLSGLDVQIHYVVLLADIPTLRERLTRRDELRYERRSLELLDKLSQDPANQHYIIDTVKKTVPEIAQEILSSSRFIVT